MNTKNKVLIITLILLLIIILAAGCKTTVFYLTFDANGGEFDGGSSTYVIETDGATTAVIPNDPTREGYSFKGWFFDKDVWEKPFTANSLFDAPIQSDITIYAKWVLIVSFNTNNGSEIADIELESVGAITLPANPTKTGYIFSGWYLDNNCFIQSANTILEADITHNLMVYAKWIPISYSITYHNENGISHNNPVTYTIENEDIILTDLTGRVGYNFTGWYTEEIGGTKVVAIFLGTIGDLVYYAHWQDINEEGIIYINDFVIVNNVLINYLGNDSIITIPDSVTCIGEGAFACNNSLTNITIPASVTSIGPSAFNQCNNLAHITFLGSITYIGSYAFESTQWYNNRSEGVIYAGRYVYGYKGTMSHNTSVNLLPGTTGIGFRAFIECDNLCSIIIPESVTSIGEMAFSSCRNLTGVSIPSSVTSIDSYSFEYCEKLSEIIVDNANPVYKSVDGVLYNKAGTTIVTYPMGNENTAFVMPDEVINIGEGAFYFNKYLSDITLCYTVTNIGNKAFFESVNLSHITISDSVINIGEYAFSNCYNLSNITLPANLTDIGRFAFMGSGLSDIIVDISNPEYKAVEGVLYNKTGTTLIQYPRGINRTSFIIPEGVNLIETSAFYNCNNLLSVTIPDCVTEIGSDAFSWSPNITNITIGNGVTTIGEYAFRECTSLENISLGSELILIGVGIIDGCNRIENISVDEDNTVYRSIDGVLFNKEGTILIQYPRGNNRTSYTIPNDVTTISDHSFTASNYLELVIVPINVTLIENYAFSFCDNLETVYIERPSSEGITIGESCILHYCHSDLKIFVPNIDSVIAYKAANHWSDYSNRIYVNPIFVEQGPINIDYYSGLTLNQIGLDKGFSWLDPYAQLYPGIHNYNALYVGDGEHFLPIEINVQVTINKIAPVITSMPEASVSDAVEGQSMPSLSGGSANVAGCFEWQQDFMNPGSFSYTWRFLPESNFYNMVTGTLTLNALAGTEGLIYNGNIVSCDANMNFSEDLIIPCRKNGTQITTIANDSFKYCDIESVIMPSIIYIGDYSFWDCTNLKTAYMPNARILGDCVFCSNKIETLDMPKMEKMGCSAFWNCTCLSEINAPLISELDDGGSQVFENSIWIKRYDFAVINKYLLKYNGTEENVVIPDEIEYIARNAFFGNHNIVTVSMPNVKVINFCAFFGCSGLITADMPLVEIIYQQSFEGCSELTSVNFPNIKQLDAFVFWDCNKLTSVNIYNAVEVSPSAFWMANGLESIEVSESNEQYQDLNGVLYTKDFNTLIMLPYAYPSESYCLPDFTVNILSILSFCNIKELDINNCVYSVEMIRNCPNLQSLLCNENNQYFNSVDGVLYNKDNTKLLVFPCAKTGDSYNALESCLEIADYAVEYTTVIKTFTGINIVKIGRNSFIESLSLENISFPELITVGDSCFEQCNNLQNVNFPSLMELGSNVINIFAGCKSLLEIDLSNLNNLVFGMFQSCCNLQEITLSDNLTSIPQYCFFLCTSLTELVLPSKISLIDANAFRGCNKLNTLVINNQNSVINLIAGEVKLNSNMIIYVPDELVENYKTAECWSAYVDQIKPLSEKDL